MSATQVRPQQAARNYERVLVMALTLIAAFLRFYRLDQIPPGFHFDQAFNAFDIVRLMHGDFEIFFPANTGREPLFIYLQVVGVTLFGPNSFALRLTSALIGVATVLLIYGFARTVFQSARLAAFAALLSAISFWHIFYSRDGLRVILEVPFTLCAFWFFWRALNRRERRDFVYTGFFTALALYTYLSGRLIPFGLILLTAVTAWSDRHHAKQYIQGLIIALVVALVLFLPLGIYFLLHPDQFISHMSQLSILSPEVNRGNVLRAFTTNAQRVLGMFLFKGDDALIRNLPGRPIFDPLIGALFLVGVAVWLVTLLHQRIPYANRRRAVFIATWLLVTLATSLFSDDAPNFLRVLPALPAVMILPAWGASEILERLRKPFPHRIAAGLLVGAFAVSGALSFRDYFLVFANSPALYYAYDVDKLEVANWINQNAHTNHIFLAPLWYEQGTISLQTRNAPLKSFDSRDTVVLPSSADGQDALFGFPPEQQKRVETLSQRLGKLGYREDLTGSNGLPLLWVYRVPAKNLPDARDPLPTLARGGAFVQPQKLEHAIWENQIELLGYTVQPNGRGRNLSVTLFLHSLKSMSEDYTFSIKVRDERERVWGQEDKWPGTNSYATSRWGVGDVVIETFYPGLNACAPAGDYHISVEAYEPKSSRVLPLTTGEGSAVALTTVRAEASQSNRLDDLDPAQSISLEIAPQAHLLGMTLTPDQARPGDLFSLALFWRGYADGKAKPRVAIHLRDSAAHDLALVQQTISIPADGRGLCTLFDLRAPTELAPGDASLFVNDVKIGSLKIER